MDIYCESKTFEKADFTKQALPKGEYENCIFSNCDFSDSDLSERRFLSCEFIECNLSLAKLNKTALQEINFKNCKMLGLKFEDCDDFILSFIFDNCILNHSSFYKLKIKKTIFRNSQMQEVDFLGSDLAGATFDNCELTKAIFEHTNLEKADFRTSYNYSFDLDANQVKKAKFSLSGVPGLLQKYDIEIDLTN
jgi:fluoroquinolone resistance protein